MHGSRSALLPVFFRLLAIEMPERIPPLCRLVKFVGIDIPHPPFESRCEKNVSYLLLLFCYKMKSKRNTELETFALN